MDNHSRVEKWLIYGVLLFFAVAIPFAALDQPGGGSSSTTGIVVSAGVLPTDGGPMPEVAAVRLSDGTTVQASVVSGGPAKRGYIAHMRVYRTVLSGSAVYEVYRTELPP